MGVHSHFCINVYKITMKINNNLHTIHTITYNNLVWASSGITQKTPKNLKYRMTCVLGDNGTPKCKHRRKDKLKYNRLNPGAVGLRKKSKPDRFFSPAPSSILGRLFIRDILIWTALYEINWHLFSAWLKFNRTSDASVLLPSSQTTSPSPLGINPKLKSKPDRFLLHLFKRQWCDLGIPRFLLPMVSLWFRQETRNRWDGRVVDCRYPLSAANGPTTGRFGGSTKPHS